MKNTLLLICLLLSALNLRDACAQNVSESDESSSKIFPYKYSVRDLDNGLRVVVVPTSYPNLVAVQIPVQVGSRNEVEPNKTGFAHFFEHMMFRGTANFSSQEFNDIYKNAGASFNAWTSDDLTNYHVTLAKEDLETALMLEADRFQFLQYSEDDFKTEAKAVLGEYNKNYADPLRKILEVQRDAAFTTHTYKHTTMGFLEDIIDMPNQYEYSKVFYDRYYRPENTIIIVAGDLEENQTFSLVEQYWGNWERGNYTADIPQEPPSNSSVYRHVEWEAPTTPWIAVAFHGPAFSDTMNDMATMDVAFQMAFSSSSPLYKKLVIQEQKVASLNIYVPDRTDPYLLTVYASVINMDDIWYVRDEILKTFAGLRVEKVSSRRLGDIKSSLKYQFANSMDSSETIAESLVHYVARTRDPESINKVYQLYDDVTVDDVMTKANTFFTDENLVVITLASESLAETASTTTNPAGSVDDLVEAMQQDPANVTSVLKQTDSPIINFRILFNVGAADDTEGKEGLAKLTASMISDAGSTSMSYKEIQEALFPMAASFQNQVDKEMTVFIGTTHIDNLDSYYEIISEQLLSPGWGEDDFKRVKTQIINNIQNELKGNNDEELGKEVLYEEIYSDDHPYGHLSYGHISALENLTLEDVQSFYREKYTLANLVLGMAGTLSDEFVARVKSNLNRLPVGVTSERKLPLPAVQQGAKALIIEKETRATAVSLGFPITVTRSHPDFAALWLARSYLGEHRSFNGRLMQRIRGIRGMNYGDYAYIEYFPRGMSQFYPDPNLGRQQQMFQIWIRPVETTVNAHFASRLAMYELNKMITNGITMEEFEATRNFLLNFVKILTSTQSRELGYALDSNYYNISEFTSYMSTELEKLSLEQVNMVIQKHLQDENVTFVYVTKNSEDLRDRLINETTSVMTYETEMTADILEEDLIIQDYELGFQSEDVSIIPVSEAFAGTDGAGTDGAGSDGSPLADCFAPTASPAPALRSPASSSATSFEFSPCVFSAFGFLLLGNMVAGL